MLAPPPDITFLTFALIGDVGGMELLVILCAILVLFGGKGVPEIARNLGRMTETLRRASDDFKKQLLEADKEPLPLDPHDPTMMGTYGQQLGADGVPISEPVVPEPAIVPGTEIGGDGIELAAQPGEPKHDASDDPKEAAPRDLAG